jgi:hypothetical protein
MKTLSIMILCLLAPAFSADKFAITSTKGVYPLYWDAIYTVNVCNGFSTVIEAPPGYIVQQVILGDSKLFRSENFDTRVVVKKVAPDTARTNMVLILQGPERVDKNVTFELTGQPSPHVSNIQFSIPTDRELNATLEAAKARYMEQMNQALADQEDKLKRDVNLQTMKEVISFRFGDYPDETSTKKLGAEVFLNAVLNSNGAGYIYFSTNAEDPNCQVVSLQSVKGKDLSKTVKLIHSYVDKGWTYYVYQTTPFPKTGKKIKYDFVFKIYQETATITAKIL